MARTPSYDKSGLRKGAWTSEEDRKLMAHIEKYGHENWRSLPAKAGLLRCGKSCRLRWNNYLRPDIKRGEFSFKEEQTIIQLHAFLGNRWSAIASYLPKRTDNDIKNYWNTHLKKKLSKMGIDPVTHKPKMDVTLSPSQQKDTAKLSHVAQWERARVQAEARLRRQSKLINYGNKSSSPALFSLPPCLDVLQAWQAQVAASTGASNYFNGANNFPASLVAGPDYNRVDNGGTFEYDENSIQADAIFSVDVDQNISSLLSMNDEECIYQNTAGDILGQSYLG